MAYETTAELQLQLAIPETLQPFETIVVNDNFRKLEQAIIDRSRKVGEVWMFGGAALPAGSLECNGQAVSRTTYAALFAAIGASAGAGNGTTTFNVPDYRGRVFVMPDGSAGRLASNDARGQAGGEETHALSVAEMPAHTHPGSVGNVSTVGTNPDGTVAHMGDLAGSVQYSQALSIASQGGGGAHQNMPPFLTGGAVLIKT